MARVGPPICSRGLLECGVCGGVYAIVVGDRYGCAGHHRGCACTNGRTIRPEELQRRALAA
ncbi:recombinase zinc beta ribbon domain-containing protein [Sphingopyxis fribergensis]|uniref:recombinase zinc beta ribbon domain-containing protein n=1 Tax=Sphingopyxis fribergensis TaxID=1515612 RepID=UPI00389AC28A